jgi:carbon-monoxide dehydrogenase small subunit/xanthine dehydrogenase small subunit
MQIEFAVNGQLHTVEVDPRETLLFVLREHLGLRGTKYGCGEGECGACTVILNGRAIASCLVQAGQVHGAQILTIEGMVQDPIGRHVLEAYAEGGAVQCGFCTPGLVLSTRALLAENPAPSVGEIQQALAGNLCRCTGYKKIVEAVAAAGKRVASEQIKLGRSEAAYRPIHAAGFVRPESLDEALALLAKGEDWQIVSGGTDAGVQFEHHLKDRRWLDLSGLDELQGISEDHEAVTIGGGVRYTDLAHSMAVRQWAKPLAQACRQVGGTQIQNAGTLAGNLVNASPAADAVPPLAVLHAVAVLRSAQGRRRVPVVKLATGPGQTSIALDEILTQVVIPKPKARTHGDGREIAFFEKLGPRKAQTIAIASVALRGWLDREQGLLKGVRVALGAVAPTVILAPLTARCLMGGPLTEERILEAGEIAAQECQPIDDIRGSAAYRRRLVRGLLVRGLWSCREGG